MKWCSGCKESKTPDNFCRNRARPDGLDTWCRGCKAKSGKAYRQKPGNREVINIKRRAWRLHRGDKELDATLRYKYGITLEERNAFIEKQDGVCALGCGRAATAVDHCHVNGHVRGVLCTQCNSALGLMQDNPKVLTAGAAYLSGRAVQSAN